MICAALLLFFHTQLTTNGAMDYRRKIENIRNTMQVGESFEISSIPINQLFPLRELINTIAGVAAFATPSDGFGKLIVTKISGSNNE